MRKFMQKFICSTLAIAMSLHFTVQSFAADETYVANVVNLHTPVMAPGTIIGDADKNSTLEKGKTSLYKDERKNPNTSQLRLDEYYFIRWKDLSELGEKHRDAPTPAYGGYDDQTDDSSTKALEEDQFTKAKYMKFPFEVVYEGKFYKANQWIKLKAPDDWKTNPAPSARADTGYKSDNHWVYTPFYIPTWAREGLYEDIDFDEYNPIDKNTCIQLRVEAINSEGDTRGGKSRAEELQYLANRYYNINVDTLDGDKYDDGAAYVATFNMPAQLSGWIYGFTITGTSDVDMFAFQDEEALTTAQIDAINDYSFAAHKQDKKSGLKNRFGDVTLRYLMDGRIARNTAGKPAWSPINTVALNGAWRECSCYNRVHMHCKGRKKTTRQRMETLC